jgi:integrase/recombinase XerD
MENFSLNGITASIFFDTRRTKENLMYPVKYRVTYLRDRFYYPSGIDLTEEQWKIIDTTKKRDLIKTRELIQSGFDQVKDHIKSMVKDETFSFEALNTRLSRGMKNSIISAFYNRVDELKKDGKIGSSDWYLYSVKILQKFTEKDMKFADVTVAWLKKYETFLLEDGKSFTSISMYMRALQSIFNSGVREGVVSKSRYPFGKGKYEIPQEEGRKMALTLSQIGKVINYPLTTETEKRCRDLWFFSYLCNGINIVDLLHLKYSDLENGKISFYRIKTISRSKNKKKIVAIILPEMQQIINRWGNPKRTDSYIFPFLSAKLTLEAEMRIVKNATSLINKKMTKIGKALGYGVISTYTSRHSFATVLKRSGANISFISESLGHTDMKTTENYLDSFEDDTKLKNASELTKFK